MKLHKKSALGRGLDALIQMDDIKVSGSSSINEIPLAQINPNPNQPRTEFDQTALEELAASIQAIGIIQPITLREVGPQQYQIIAGERRYRASLLAQKETIPAYVRTANDENVVEMALIENIQREDLNAIEVALTYQKLRDQYGLTQEQLSARIGKNRSTITNFLRLLKLPAEIQMGLTTKKIDMGHARALLSLEDAQMQLAIYEAICTEHLSVRKVEELVKQVSNNPDSPTNKDTKAAVSNKQTDYDILKKHLSTYFQTPVQFTCNNAGKGKISIPFKTEEELERIIGIFDKLQH